MNDLEFLTYLDETIQYWRRVRDGKESCFPDFKRENAVYYIDAYQAIRDTKFGSTLK